MPNLNFQNRFVNLILSGEKTSTIRKPKKDGRLHCEPGQEINLYAGQGTKECRLIKTVVCRGIAKIELSAGHECDAFYAKMEVGEIQGEPHMASLDQRALATQEGFDNLWEMQKFFKEMYGLPFSGYLIKWV